MPIIDADRFEDGNWCDGFDFASANNLDDDILVNFLQELSKTILRDEAARAYPDVITFGYVCRPANIKRALVTLEHINRRIGWGTAVHITPANIPVNFAFSFLMGFLSGNSNIVRVPTKAFEQVDIIVSTIEKILQKTEFEQLQTQIAFMRTHHKSLQLEKLIQTAQCLLVWGSDETVNQFRALPKRPRCVEAYFPNRASSLIIDAHNYLAVADTDDQKISRNFYNDTFLVDQNACSSPNIIYWLGDAQTIDQAKHVYWSKMDQFVSQHYQLDPVARNDRLLDMMRFSIAQESPIKVDQHSNNIWRLDNPDLNQHNLRYGTFLDISLNELEQLPTFIRDNEQTLTVYGLDCERIFTILKQAKRPVDRIVPMGQALDIGLMWDGKNLLSLLSRQTQVG